MFGVPLIPVLFDLLPRARCHNAISGDHGLFIYIIQSIEFIRDLGDDGLSHSRSFAGHHICFKSIVSLVIDGSCLVSLKLSVLNFISEVK